MRTVIAVAMLATCMGCSASWGAEHHRTLHAANTTLALAAVVTTALDWCGTRHAAATRHDAWEGGMPTSRVIGTSPSKGAVDAYFAVSALALGAAAQLLPERYRWLAYGAVAGVEAYTVAGNISTTRCGSLGSN